MPIDRRCGPLTTAVHRPEANKEAAAPTRTPQQPTRQPKASNTEREWCYIVSSSFSPPETSPTGQSTERGSFWSYGGEGELRSLHVGDLQAKRTERRQAPAATNRNYQPSAAAILTKTCHQTQSPKPAMPGREAWAAGKPCPGAPLSGAFNGVHIPNYLKYCPPTGEAIIQRRPLPRPFRPTTGPSPTAHPP